MPESNAEVRQACHLAFERFLARHYETLDGYLRSGPARRRGFQIAFRADWYSVHPGENFQWDGLIPGQDFLLEAGQAQGGTHGRIYTYTDNASSTNSLRFGAEGLTHEPSLRRRPTLIEEDGPRDIDGNPYSRQASLFPNLAVCNGRVEVSIIAAEEKEEFIKHLAYLNRWWFREGAKHICFFPTDKPVTDRYEMAWHTRYVAGHAGWDAIPTQNEGREAVLKNYSAEKEALVRAPTAHLAIERAKLLLTRCKKS